MVLVSQDDNGFGSSRNVFPTIAPYELLGRFLGLLSEGATAEDLIKRLGEQRYVVASEEAAGLELAWVSYSSDAWNWELTSQGHELVGRWKQAAAAAHERDDDRGDGGRHAQS